MSELDPATFVPVSQALWRFPVLEGLLDLSEAEWTFRELEDDRGLTALYGHREYPHFNEIDAMKIESETAARAQRTKIGDGLLKQHEGTLRDVVDFLLNLPHPAERNAPHLILGSMPQQLWTPNQNR